TLDASAGWLRMPRSAAPSALSQEASHDLVEGLPPKTSGCLPAASVPFRGHGSDQTAYRTPGGSGAPTRQEGLATTTRQTLETLSVSCRGTRIAPTRTRRHPTSGGSRTGSRLTCPATNCRPRRIPQRAYLWVTSTSCRSCSSEWGGGRVGRGGS